MNMRGCCGFNSKKTSTYPWFYRDYEYRAQDYEDNEYEDE